MLDCPCLHEFYRLASSPVCGQILESDSAPSPKKVTIFFRTIRHNGVREAVNRTLALRIILNVLVSFFSLVMAHRNT